MATQTYTITINDDFVVPAGEIGSDQEYLTFVLNMAARSYQAQHGADSALAGITAARAAYNAALPEAPE